MDVVQYYQKVLKEGGEGLVLTSPESLYEASKSRSKNRVKLKGRNDAEGVVKGYNLGYKRDPSYMKSLILTRGNNTSYQGPDFNLGIGFKMDQRKDYKKMFPIGTLVTFSYREYASSGKPKEGRFVRVRQDI